jgi:transposase, IS6 family
MPAAHPFKWRHYQAAIILLCVRWYVRYALSYRDLEEMMAERGLKVDHSTMARWVLAFAPELEKRVKPQLKPTNDSWRVDETYIRVKGQWVYQYRALDSAGNTLDFRLSANRDAEAATAFFEKTLGAPHTCSGYLAYPRMIKHVMQPVDNRGVDHRVPAKP